MRETLTLEEGNSVIDPGTAIGPVYGSGRSSRFLDSPFMPLSDGSVHQRNGKINL
jgi:hypothetical protein